MPGWTLKEIHKASGGAWGGIQVNEAFKQFIINLVGNAVFSRFQAESNEEYLDILRDFETKKREIAPGNDKNVTFRLPLSIKEIFEKETDDDFRVAIKQTKYADKIYLSSDKLRVDDSVMRNLFSHAIQNTVSHLKDMIKNSEVRGISNFLMVGGYSESKMLQGAIKSNFPYIKVIVPQEAGLVVLKGAVVFGHRPFSIAQRVCMYTYGVGTTLPIDDTIHDPARRIQCDIEIGQLISLNETKEEKLYFANHESQRSVVSFHVYASTKFSPLYVTDTGCVNLGNVEADILDISVPRKERSVPVSMTFGGAEFESKQEKKDQEKLRKLQ